MSKKFFETHLLMERKSPFILHLDIQKENSAKPHNMNWHTSVELLYFTEGKGTVFCGTASYEVSAGDLFIVSAYMPHAIVSDNTVYYYCLIVDEKFCQANDMETENLIYKTPARDEKFDELFAHVICEFHQNRAFKNAGMKAAVLTLMVYLTRNYVESVRVPKQPISVKDESIRLAIGYMKAHITQKLTLEQIANEAGLSKYYFLREFKRMTGETPISFINKTRCEAAKKLLMTGRYSMKEVAEKTGYDDLSYFSKNFKKYIGTTPSQYAKSVIPKSK